MYDLICRSFPSVNSLRRFAPRPEYEQDRVPLALRDVPLVWSRRNGRGTPYKLNLHYSLAILIPPLWAPRVVVCLVIAK